MTPRALSPGYSSQVALYHCNIGEMYCSAGPPKRGFVQGGTHPARPIPHGFALQPALE